MLWKKQSKAGIIFRTFGALFCDNLISVVFLGIDAARKTYSCISIFKTKHTVLSRNCLVHEGGDSV